MQTLLLMRHAKSDWPTGGMSDFDRPLASRGVKAANKIGELIAAQLPMPDVIISSPAKRTVQTAEIVAKVTGYRDTIVGVSQIYEASVTTLEQVIAHYEKDADTLLVVGHNPGLEDLLLHLVADSPDHYEASKLFPAGALAHLSIAAGVASLQGLYRPREL